MTPLRFVELGYVIEVASLALFGWCWVEARRRRDGLDNELLVAALYGWLLEALDMRIFRSYHYGPVTWWWIAEVPLYIPLLWATIVHSSMALSDSARLPGWAKPFLDGLLAVLIDLAVDAIAIRVGLWHWRIRLDEGWFGVPPGNLCAWMWVAACYSGAARLVRRRIQAGRSPGWHRLAVPLIAYAGLFGLLLLMGVGAHLAGLETQDRRLWLFAAHLAGFSAVCVAGCLGGETPGTAHVTPSLVWTRWLIHGSFFVILWVAGIGQQMPALALVSLGSMALEWLAQRWCEPRASPFWQRPGSSTAPLSEA